MYYVREVAGTAEEKDTTPLSGTGVATMGHGLSHLLAVLTPPRLLPD